MGDISKHLSRYECACKCGCGYDTVDIHLVTLFEMVRLLNGDVPLTPNSSCRCEKHNKKVDGDKGSQHLVGKAMDLPVKDPQYVYSKLCKYIVSKYGFIVYDNFIHVDVRHKKYRDDRRTVKQGNENEG